MSQKTKTQSNRNRKGRIATDKRGYCGPTAITVLTGRSMKRVEKDLIDQHNKSKYGSRKPIDAIKGLSKAKMTGYLKFNCKLTVDKIFQGDELWPMYHKKKPVKTAGQWAKATYGKRGRDFFLMVVGGRYRQHYIVIKGLRKWCSFEKPEGVSIKQWKHFKGSKVHQIWKITKEKNPRHLYNPLKHSPYEYFGKK
jgi:hypothetical protein